MISQQKLSISLNRMANKKHFGRKVKSAYQKFCSHLANKNIKLRRYP